MPATGRSAGPHRDPGQISPLVPAPLKVPRHVGHSPLQGHMAEQAGWKETGRAGGAETWSIRVVVGCFCTQICSKHFLCEFHPRVLFWGGLGSGLHFVQLKKVDFQEAQSDLFPGKGSVDHRSQGILENLPVPYAAPNTVLRTGCSPTLQANRLWNLLPHLESLS